MWADEFRIDGFRLDNVENIYTYTDPSGARVEIPEGLLLAREANELLDGYPNLWTVGEVLANDGTTTLPTASGGMGFTTQWRAPILTTEQMRGAASLPNLTAIKAAVIRSWNGIPYSALSFVQSHDHDRPAAIVDPDDPASFPARKLSALFATIAFTSLGVPMTYQGEEFVSCASRNGTTSPIDWGDRERYRGKVDYFADLVRLRGGRAGLSAGLRGDHVVVYPLQHLRKTLAYHRFDAGGPRDDVVVIANFGSTPLSGFQLGLPRPGRWEVRLNGDEPAYGVVCDPGCSSDYTDVGPRSVIASGPPTHGMLQSGRLDVGPYSALILSQNCASGDDADLDGACDGDDNCTLVANDDQRDVDRDGYGDACDRDLDDDGAVSLADVSTALTCLGQAVPGTGPSADPYCRESDVVVDAAIGMDDVNAVLAVLGTTPGPSALACAGSIPCVSAQGDADGDAIPNGQDNCLLVENFVQDDGDEDGIGNACDCDFNDDGICGGADNLIFLFDWCVHNPSFVGADYCEAHPSYDGLMCNLDCTLQSWPEVPTGFATDMNGDSDYTVEDGDLYNALTHLANGAVIVGVPGPTGLP
jgi:hypothetical protein